MSDNPVKLLYIAGYGRSGSTILDRLLGQLDGFVSVGELDKIWRHGFIEDQFCACGDHFSSCAFWSAVAQHPAFPSADVEAIVAARQTLRMRNLPRLKSRTLRSSTFEQDLQFYLSAHSKLLHAIRDVAGAKVVVDSSKIPMFLYAAPELDDAIVHVLHLVRDVRAVAHSSQRRKVRPAADTKVQYLQRDGPARVACGWTWWNMLAEGAGDSSASWTRLRYEDLMKEPRATLRRLTEIVGEETDAIDFVNHDGAVLETAHLIAGNPVRFQKGHTPLKPDLEWTYRMATWRRHLVTALAWPLLKRYGYSK